MRIGAVARLIILWQRPYHLTADDAAGWTRRHIGRMLDAGAVRDAELTLLRSASDRHPADCRWMLRLDLEPGVDGCDYVEGPRCAEWLDDMRSLGAQPFVMLADSETIERANRA
jgi:hypothetical protein